MDRTLTGAADRRANPRRARTATAWYAAVLVRPGREGRLLDVSDGGALIEINTPLRPGSRIHLQLSARDVRLPVHGHVARCYVAAVTADAGVRYHGAIVFDAPLPSLLPRRVAGAGDGAPAEYAVPDMGTRATREHGHALPVSAARDKR